MPPYLQILLTKLRVKKKYLFYNIYSISVGINHVPTFTALQFWAKINSINYISH